MSNDGAKDRPDPRRKMARTMRAIFVLGARPARAALLLRTEHDGPSDTGVHVARTSARSVEHNTV